MKCPNCKDVTLVMTERNGIEIDYCPQCRGVWLDRGELDKLLEKAAGQGLSASAAAPAPQRGPVPAAQVPHPDFVDSDFRHRQSGYGYKRRKSWLSDIFD